MKIKHLSDYDIQQFAFDSSECKQEVIKHMSSCETCKMRVESYSSLSYAIKNQPDPILEFNLSNTVLKQLETTTEEKPYYSYSIYFLIVLSIGVVISSLYYFKETFIDLFKSNSAISMSFIIIIIALISLVMILDMLRSFNKKINMLKY